MYIVVEIAFEDKDQVAWCEMGFKFYAVFVPEISGGGGRQITTLRHNKKPGSPPIINRPESDPKAPDPQLIRSSAPKRERKTAVSLPPRQGVMTLTMNYSDVLEHVGLKGGGASRVTFYDGEYTSGLQCLS
ncbi:hypothetical protein CEXT_276651 [Caerostris extrusa]|uniref:Uncharacterized protein n=1 Tax=Caerostris extrusa TaxID=172846 RepID=A0AAV4XBS7_CAEEX|nr:hypothetical protein CEXT_276651 [Caerostris extrusa]